MYGYVPSGNAFIFYILVLALSNGNDMNEAKNPLPALAKQRVNCVSLELKCLFNLSLNSSYGPNIPKFNTTALTTVGVHPLHNDMAPSSLTIL